jgi:DNA polymerase-3 subunit gamma/tau
MMSLLIKYRPEKWEAIVGQEAAVRSLRAALQKRASHAFLLVGPSGVGKTTIARLAAKELGCSPSELIEIDGATYTGIDDMRAVTSGLNYRPMGSEPAKGIIVDECHYLSKNAWNSLLKSIEEPPPWVYWFLCTTEAGKVPAAIRTRCLSYELKPVSLTVLQGLLTIVARAERISLDPKIIALCAKEANGSPRQSLSNLAVCLNARTREEAAELLLTAEDAPEAIDFVRALYRGAGWAELQRLLQGLREMNAESIRQVVRAYGTKVVLGAKTEQQAGSALEVLDAFSTPCYGSEGITPILLAVARLTLSGD